MSDDDFDAVLDKYFAWPGTWNLFTAICLMQKINPATRTNPIKHDMPTDDPDGGTDYTIRPYKIALEAIQEAKSGRRPAKNEAPNLIEVEYKAEEIGAKIDAKVRAEMVKFRRSIGLDDTSRSS